MHQDVRRIDSSSVGDPARYRSLEDLDRDLAASEAPADSGRVVMIVTRGQQGLRESLDRARVTPEAGVPGDAWGRGRKPHPDAQITVMQLDVATSIANGQPLELFGDNLFLDLDLSRENLPRGTRLGVGTATLEITPMPHNGCRKFLARFGADALHFVSRPETRYRNLRGVYMRVVQAGEIAAGDEVVVLSRPSGSGQQARV